MNKIYTKIKHCRICGEKKLIKIVDLKNQYIQGLFVKIGDPKPYSKKIPLQLVLCKNCSLVQLHHSTDKDILYKNYWYQSGVNKTMRDHLHGIVKILITFFRKQKKKIYVLDIGCNDGTLLNFYPKKIEKYGIDPSQIINKINKKEIKVFRDFFPPTKEKFKKLKIKFNIITSIAMFYDLDDPNFFVKEIKKYLNEHGIWVFELSYLVDMLKLNSFDTICHEHLEYYSLTSLNYLLKKHKLKIFKVMRNKINGGSVRCFVTHEKNSKFDTKKDRNKIKNLLTKEKRIKINSEYTYKKFVKRINKIKKQTTDLLKNLKNKNKEIHIYGASTKGNTILQWYGIDKKLIKYAADRNQEKWGTHTIGSKINIISERQSKLMNPDYYFVLPWHFKKEFIQREKKFLNSGGKMIFPLPKIKIY